MHWQALAGIGVYVVLMVVVGAIAARKVASSSDFINAGRSLGFMLCTATLFASWFGGGTVLGSAGAAYTNGLLGVIADPFGAALVLFLAGMFVLRPIRRLQCTTIVSFYERRYSRTVGALAAVFEIVMYVGWSGALIVSFGFVTHALTGISETWSILVGGLVIMVYTWAGGMWAVTLTDAVQMIVLITGLLFIAPLSIEAVGGWQAFLAQVPDAHFHLWPQEASLRPWLAYVAAWMAIGLGSLPEQALVQRGTASRSEAVAVWSAYVGAGLYLTVGLIPPMLGAVGGILFPGLENPEMVMPELAMRLLSPLGVTIFLGALVAAIMSSADSAVLAPAVITGENLLKYFRPNASDALVLRVSRAMVPVYTVLCTAVALYAKVVYDLMVLASTLLLVSLVVPLLGGLYWRRATSRGAAVSMVVGGCVFGLLSLWQDPVWPAEIVALGANLATYVVVSLRTQPVDVSSALFTSSDGMQLRLRDKLGILSPWHQAAQVSAAARLRVAARPSDARSEAASAAPSAAEPTQERRAS